MLAMLLVETKGINVRTDEGTAANTALLAGIGTCCCGPSERPEAAWDARCDELEAFGTTHHGRLPIWHEPSHEALASWMFTQQSTKTTGAIREARGRRLEGVKGWRWSTRNLTAARAWDAWCDELEAFGTSHHGRLPESLEPGHEALASWMRR